MSEYPIHAFGASAFENYPDGVVIMDRNLKVFAWNPTIARISGIPSSAAISAVPSDCALKPADWPFLHQRLR